MRYLSASILLAGIGFLYGGVVVTDLDRMQGVWSVVSLVEKGNVVPQKDIELLEVAISRDTFLVTEKGKKDGLLVDYVIKLDPSKKPKTIDFTHVQGEFKGKTEPGIYTFDKEGNMIKLVLDEDKKGRPTVFDGKETASYSVMILKRIGKK